MTARYSQLQPEDRITIAPHCPLCGQANACAASAAGSFAVDCWCRQVDFSAALLAAVPPEQQGQACICRRCAEGASDRDLAKTTLD